MPRSEWEQPGGIGGWLLLVVLHLVVTPIRAAYFLDTVYRPLLQNGTWHELTTPGTAAYHPLWGPVLVFEVVGKLGTLALGLIALARLLRREPGAPALAIAWFAFNAAFAALDYSAASLIPGVAAHFDDENIRYGLIQPLLAAAIWIPYLRVSARVEATFAEVQSPREAPPAESGDSPGGLGAMPQGRSVLRTAMLSSAPSVGIAIVVGVAVGFLTRSLWEPRFFGASSHGGELRRVAGNGTAVRYTPEDYKKAATRCRNADDLECAEKNWMVYLNLRPKDGAAYASLGIVRNQRDDHSSAIIAFERAIDLGEGTYDLFAYYADSLAKVGRTEDAVSWYYKTLAVVPSLVDVRGSLAKLLMQQRRYYEALSLLEAFDAQLQAKGLSPYFEGQRISIETALNRSNVPHAAQPALRLPKYEDHFYAPVSIGDGRPEAFVVDTGASTTMMDEALLKRSKARYKPAPENAFFRTADGRTVAAKAVVVESFKVGPYSLRDVSAVTCNGCVSLLGQSTLSRFDLTSARMNSVEFLTLSLRP
jgi:predicted aspartyl protease